MPRGGASPVVAAEPVRPHERLLAWLELGPNFHGNPTGHRSEYDYPWPMKPVAVLLGMVVLTISAPASHDRHAAPAAAVVVAPPVVREPSEQFDVPIRHAKQGGLHVYLPENCILDADFDLVLHFHGAPPVFAKALRESGINAAIAVENLGLMSNAYKSRYSLDATFEFLKHRIVKLVDRACPGAEHQPRRVALSAWSAGYAAVEDILASPERAAEIDAVLLADGMHSAFMHPKLRDLPDNALKPFVEFAREAVAGKKFMIVTHSDVTTGEYASTTESADFLLGKLNVSRESVDRSGPLDGMHQVTEATSGNFKLMGFDGGNEKAHSQHLWAFRDTLLEPLREHWESTAPPVTDTTKRSGQPISVTVEVNDDELCTVIGDYVECRESR